MDSQSLWPQGQIFVSVLLFNIYWMTSSPCIVVPVSANTHCWPGKNADSNTPPSIHVESRQSLLSPRTTQRAGITYLEVHSVPPRSQPTSHRHPTQLVGVTNAATKTWLHLQTLLIVLTCGTPGLCSSEQELFSLCTSKYMVVVNSLHPFTASLFPCWHTQVLEHKSIRIHYN